MTKNSAAIRDYLTRAERAIEQGSWLEARDILEQLSVWLPQASQVHHHLATAQLALGQAQFALQSADRAIALAPMQWQTHLVRGKSLKTLKQIEAADASFDLVIDIAPSHGEAFIAKADLAMNVFGLPLHAIELVRPFLSDSSYAVDAELTTLLASLYDRDISALDLTARVIRFSRTHMRLPDLQLPKLLARKKQAHRKRIGLISPLFCNSPVYFLTISVWRQLAREADLVVFNRGYKLDWATKEFRELSDQWVDVQPLSATELAKKIYHEDLDVLYELGGWMDPTALKALSAQPARAMYKWVGGQSMTTGLDNFDGWMGDQWQSPLGLQHLYTEPIMNADGGYVTYVPPSYLPKSIPISSRRKEPVIFSNPAKLSRGFLFYLRQYKGTVCFLHHQYQYARTREHIYHALNESKVIPEFICPTSHREALETLAQFRLMIDTFPYSGGLTAREAHALGLEIHGFSGELFCERHSLQIASKQLQVNA